MNELTLLTFGIYDVVLPNQNGAPLRVVVVVESARAIPDVVREDGRRLYLGVVFGEAVLTEVVDKVNVVRDARLLLVHRSHVEPETKLRIAG